jgi:regulator of protease activity HflC (stomatin/prohibitin superfamily)
LCYYFHVVFCLHCSVLRLSYCIRVFNNDTVIVIASYIVLEHTYGQESAVAWGLDILRYEITEVTPDKFIVEAMDKQAGAERDRRKKVLEAEGDKRSAELESEGVKIRLKNESEGTLIKVTNEAQARKMQIVLEAEGEVSAIKMRAEAQATALNTLAEALAHSAHSGEAAKLAVAREFITMYSDIGQKSNTMIFSERPGDLNALLAQASSVVRALGDSSSAPAGGGSGIPAAPFSLPSKK